MRKPSDEQLVQLSLELLAAYQHATRLRQYQCAEHVFLALEDLARSSPACSALVDEAYLRRVCGAKNTAA